jgi:hypothetical protein
MMTRRTILFSLALIFVLAGCWGSSSKTGAVGAVERYYQAIVSQDADQFTSVTCADYEEAALIELDSFQGVKAELQGFSCQETGTQGEFTLVQCAGKIAASYGNEVRDFPLDDRIHKVKNEGGDWRVCGY